MFKTNYRGIPYEHGIAGCPEIAVQIDSRCGLSCAECTYKEATGCGGCIATNGHPFHGECELAKCAENKGKRFCGECPEFPDCELLNRFSYDPVHGENGGRIERCITLKNAMIAAARKALPSPVCLWKPLRSLFPRAMVRRLSEQLLQLFLCDGYAGKGMPECCLCCGKRV